MIVLASSRKLGGRCVAGISTVSGDWVRPVSGLPEGLKEHRCQVDGRWPEPLDIVRFDYQERLTDPAQPENVLIGNAAWELIGQLDREDAYDELENILVSGSSLFGNRGRAVKDEVAAEGVEYSLALVEPSSVAFLMRLPEETRGKLKPHALFELGRWGKTEYELPLTDIPAEAAVRAAGVGSFAAEQLGFGNPAKTLLTISLGEVHEGWHSKLVAAVLFLP